MSYTYGIVICFQFILCDEKKIESKYCIVSYVKTNDSSAISPSSAVKKRKIFLKIPLQNHRKTPQTEMLTYQLAKNSTTANLTVYDFKTTSKFEELSSNATSVISEDPC